MNTKALRPVPTPSKPLPLAAITRHCPIPKPSDNLADLGVFVALCRSLTLCSYLQIAQVVKVTHYKIRQGEKKANRLLVEKLRREILMDDDPNTQVIQKSQP